MCNSTIVFVYIIIVICIVVGICTCTCTGIYVCIIVGVGVGIVTSNITCAINCLVDIGICSLIYILINS